MSASTKLATSYVRYQAAEMLAEGKGVKEIAEALDINRTTIWKWMQKPEVAAHYLVSVNTRAASYAKDAIDCLRTLLNDPDCPAAVKVAAAKLLLDRADKLIAERDERVIDLRAENDNAQSEPEWKANPFGFLKGEKK